MVARILIVEDNAPNLELEQYLLECGGYTTLSAADGAQGLRMARKEIPDLVLCDLQMPVMTGYELIAEYKNDPRLRFIPIIAVTASSMSDDSRKAIEAGFTAYIPNPIEPETFVQQIEVYLPLDLRVIRTSDGN